MANDNYIYIHIFINIKLKRISSENGQLITQFNCIMHSNNLIKSDVG